MSGWRSGAHALSANAVPLTMTRGELLPFVSLHDNACLSCHKTHSAPQRERLLRERSPDLCLGCHDGLSARNILATSGRRSGHRPERFRDVHDAAENPRTMRPHVECVDCHNPHAARGAPLALARGLSATQGPLVAPAMELVPGVTLAGAQVERARFEYEVCFRCHADNPAPARNRIVRQRDAAGNVRRETLPTAASAHPITSPSRPDSDSPSLLPEFRASRFVRCQDCHDNPDARALGGGGPNGPHGSRFDFLLVDRYDTSDFTIESTQSFALCYRCHDRNSILNDDSFPLHRLHVVTGRSPCSACHAPHGVSGSRANHDHLINFDLSIVRGEQLFVDTGRFAGACTLTCHGVRHVNFVYGGAAGAGR
jgi:predicted CXXCH cytochrome family protein